MKKLSPYSQQTLDYAVSAVVDLVKTREETLKEKDAEAVKVWAEKFAVLKVSTRSYQKFLFAS